MKIILAEHRGFCYGVKRAIEMAQACIDPNKGKAWTLGPIIHNPQMVARLLEQGIGVAEQLNDIPCGTVIIRSHGVGPEIYEKAESKNLHVVDATCPHVKKAQEAAYQLAQEGYEVVVIGERHHPEVKSIIEWAGKRVMVVETPAEARAIPFRPRLGIVSQTTFAGELLEDIVNILRTKCNEIKVNRTICTATELRQQSAVLLARQVEVIIVVGGKNSANTARLAQLCQQAGSKVYHIETAQELHQEWFKGVSTVGITAGASTPDWLIEEVYNKMQEFGEMFEQEVKKLETGSIVKGKVVGVRKDEIFVDIGYKAEGIIPLAELAYPVPETAFEAVTEGEIIDVLVLDADPNEGGIKLSKTKADRIVAWDKFEQAMNDQQTVEGKVVEAVKGGLVVAVFGIRGFVPASQVDLKFVEDLTAFVGQTFVLLPIEIDREKQRAVLSRKALLLKEREQKEKEVYDNLAEGQICKGTVRRLANFGAFVDLGGVDGLIHISDLSWQRVKTPDEVVNVGDEVEVMVLKVDAKAKKIALSLKQVQRDPWFTAVEEFSEGMNVKGKVTKTVKIGAFVELRPGVEGLVHISELAERRVASAEEVVSAGQQVTVKILNIDKQTKRIALSIIKAQEDTERAEYQSYLTGQQNLGVTIGDKLGHLFKRED